MAAALPPPARRQVPVQFSLGGMMFVFVLGVSVGFAYWRLPLSTFTDGLLASFTTWFLFGIAQRLRRDLSQIHQCVNLSREERWGSALQVSVSCVTVILLVIAGIVGEYCRRGSAAGIPWNGRPAASAAAKIIFFLAIMAGYWSPPVAVTSPRRSSRIVRLFLDAALIGLSAYWAATALMEVMLFVQFAHIACRGAELSQPTRWAGRPFYAFKLHPPTAEQFISGMLGALTLLSMATAANGLMLHYWRRGWLLRVALLCVSIPCAAVAAYQITCWWSTGLPELSPFLALAIKDVAQDVLPILAVLMVVVGVAIAMTLTVTRKSTDDPADASWSVTTPPLLHEHVAVVSLCIFAVTAAMVADIWGILVREFSAQFDRTVAPRLFPSWVWSSCQQYTVERPEQFIGLAAVVVLTRFLWRRWRGLADSFQVWLVEPDQFFATWLVSVVTIGLLIPLAVWWCFVAALALAPVQD
jgi:hypothetical protein